MGGVTMGSEVSSTRSGKCWCEEGVTEQIKIKNWKDFKACYLPEDVDGGWSGYGTCSASCGGGWRYRKCNNPRPVANGKNCTGSHRQFCYLVGCPTTTTMAPWTTMAPRTTTETTATNEV